jgi:hypothetical protein
VRLKVFILTTGEACIHDAITCFHWHTPVPYDLTIWYDACGRGVDWKFFDSLGKHTDDLILCTRDKKINGAHGFATVYLDYDFLLLMSADLMVKADYWARIMKPFADNAKMGMSGEAWRDDVIGEYETSNFARGIDALMLIKRAAVNSAGGMCPSFNGKGPAHFEFQRRLVANGWEFAAINGLCDHGGEQHEGRDKDPEWRKSTRFDDLAIMRAAMKGYKSYNWWSNGN